MDKKTLNKLVGTLAIALAIVLIFLISWLFNRPSPQIEGPHLFLDKDHFRSLTINITGRRFDLSIDTIERSSTNPISLNVSIPDSKSHFSFYKRQTLQSPSSSYTQPSKILVLSDLEGNFQYFVNMLQSSGVIDKNYNWTYGSGHLVIVGDVFDRGPYVTECLWLIYKLEQDAEAAGGHVHFVLGNHEIMALQGDHRYIDRKYKRISNNLNLQYKDLFGTNTELGAWLRTKNSLEKIGEILFVHGGLSPSLQETKLGIEEINHLVRAHIDKPVQQNKEVDLIFGSDGPLWYRGLVEDPISQPILENVLTYYNAQKVVIGHTVVNDISSLFNQRVYAIDMKRTGNSGSALLIEGGDHYYTINTAGAKTKL